MADLNVSCSAGEAAITSTARTVLAVAAPSNQRLRVKGIEIFGKGTSNTDTPVKVELIKAASITSGTAGSVTTSTLDPDYGETPQATYTGNYSAEPTYGTGTTVRTLEVHPQTGLVLYFPMHDEIKIAGGKAFGVRMTSNQNETMAVTLIVEE
jgi:hypothetical protein